MMTELVKCQVSGKRSFSDEAATIAFEERNREQYKNPRQFAYPCEDCDAWHLTSSPPGNATIAKTWFPEAPPTPKSRRLDAAEIHRMRDGGIKARDIAKEFGVTATAIYYYFRKTAKPVPRTAGSSPATV